MISVERNQTVLKEIRDLTDRGRRAERHAALWQHWQVLHHYLGSFELDNATPERLLPYINDALPRFLHTLDLLPFDAELRVLELGANPYLFTLLMKRFHRYDLHLGNFTSGSIYETAVTSGAQDMWSNGYAERHTFPFTSFNLELGDYPYMAQTFDVIIYAEILEHLIVDPIPVFEKLRRLLKPGGALLLTTPNATRLVNMAHLLAGRNFFDRYHPENGVYGRHNREFTVAELTELLPAAGFEIEEAETRDRYNYDEVTIFSDDYAPQQTVPYTKKKLEAVLRFANARGEHRGDNIYVVARNAGSAP